MAISSKDTAIEPPRRLARLTVDLSAVRANWRTFATRAGTAEAAAVIKADAYGLGAHDVAMALAQEGVRTIFVASAGEGVAARRTLGDAHYIYVLNGPTPTDVAALAAAHLFPVLNSLDQIRLWIAAGAPTAAALHIDTGMNRLGVSMDEVSTAKDALAHADLPLVMSHLACASDHAHPLNQIQARRFSEAAALFPGARRSLSATAGALHGPGMRFDMIRPGIGLYGDTGLDGDGPDLAVAATLEAPILQIRDVPADSSIGYGATFVPDRPIRTATIALGYADGYLRAASGRGYGVLAGVRCPVLGRISMDLITLDVSSAGDDAVPGAPVEMLGGQVRLKDVALAAGTAPYEVLTALSGVTRVHVRGGQ